MAGFLALAAQSAPLDGQTILATDFHGTAPDTTAMVGPVASVVGPGVELTDFGWEGFLTIDVSNNQIVITAATDQPFGFFELVRFVGRFGSLAVDPATDYAGFDASRISASADVIELNLTGLEGLQGQQIVLNFAEAVAPTQTPTATPTTTPTSTPTPTDTPTPRPSETPSPSASPVRTVTPQPANAPSLSPRGERHETSESRPPTTSEAGPATTSPSVERRSESETRPPQPAPAPQRARERHEHEDDHPSVPRPHD